MTDREEREGRSVVPIGVLVSGSGTNLQAILDATEESGFPASVAVVISNRRDAFGLERARRAGIPAVWVPHRGKDRAAFETALVAVLQEHGVEWVFLAGFMRILTGLFLNAFPDRVINIHPALLPAFPGVNAQGQAHDYGVRISGVTVHFVDEGTDTGPIVAQGAAPILPTDDATQVQQRLLRLEHELLPKVVKWAAEGRLNVIGRKVEVRLPEGDSHTLWLDG